MSPPQTAFGVSPGVATAIAAIADATAVLLADADLPAEARVAALAGVFAPALSPTAVLRTRLEAGSLRVSRSRFS